MRGKIESEYLKFKVNCYEIESDELLGNWEWLVNIWKIRDRISESEREIVKNIY